jgi:hypothetical protein
MEDRERLLELLSQCLEKLTDTQFGELIGLVLTPAQQDDLSKPVTKASFLKDVERWGFLDKLEDKLRKRWPELLYDLLLPLEKLRPSALPLVPFKNREDEIALILSSFGEPHYLIDAPAGYGKTVLLSQLRELFESQDPKWVCALASMRSDSRISDLASRLAQRLGLSRSPSGEDARRFGGSLASQLKNKRAEDIRSGGVVLLIDLDRSSSTDLAKEIIDHFVPGIWEGLKTLDFQAPRKQKPFRVILAGRHLTRELPADIPGWKRKRLSPFAYKAVYETARDYLVGHTEHEPSIKTIAAHILYLTGGHPGCMARLLRSYREKGLTPDDFLAQSMKQVERGQDNVVQPAIDRAYESVSSDLQEAFDKLCVFRYLIPDMFSKVLGSSHPLLKDQDEHDLADRLTKIQQLHRDGYFLAVDIIRRLLVIRLRRSAAAEFAHWCQDAKALCEGQLKKSNAQRPAKWAIECLFQFLQQHADDVLVPEKRIEIRDKFFGHQLSEVLDTLVRGRNIKEERNVLQQELAKDWEFEFTVNYFLRRDVYEDEPYQGLLQQVKCYFDQKIRTGGGS